METSPDIHGGNREAVARRLGCRPHELLDASASLVPFGPPPLLLRALRRGLAGQALREYPDRGYHRLRQALAALHGVEPAAVLPGNGAAELFTWAGRDAAAAGVSLLPTPGFADYARALDCWGGVHQSLPLPLVWPAAFPQPFPAPPPHPTAPAAALWLTNPHHPTGQLWSRASLEPLLDRFALVIVDEAFLPLVPDGERQSLIPLLERRPGLVVIRSLTKLLGIAGLRLGYALAGPERLARWARWRDPWPVNGLAALAGERLLADAAGFARWQARVQAWTAREGAWLGAQLAAMPGLRPLPSAANFLLLRGEGSLEPLRRALEGRERVLLRDCRSFAGLGSDWLRLALLDRRANRRLLAALRRCRRPG
ncbi:MAG: aminotransferase class I/II-fold pyridoxal phosphate-dependent enzyme [Synechococcaceae cyanobacterium]|nr:aminotransferase class I/II-fold pyridoxal phosphate-dependent enzyme [Synechococcaceae cyanobacterium]